MYYLIADRLVCLLKKRNIIKKENNKIMKTVIEYIVTMFINAILAAGIGHTFQIESKLIVFSIFYSILRVSAGGCYLKLDMKNSVMRWALAVVLIRVAEIVALDMAEKWIMVSFILMSAMTVLAFAPCKSGKTELPDVVKQSMRKRSIVTIAVLSALLLVGIVFFENNNVISAVVGVFVQSLSLLPTSMVGKQVVELETYAV